MPLELFKRRHSPKCLALIAQRVAEGKMKTPPDLEQYKGCSCAWWVKGINDHGRKIPRTSTKARTWEAACAALRKFNQPEADRNAKPRLTLRDALNRWYAELDQNNHPRSTLRAYQSATEEMFDFVNARDGKYLDDVSTERLEDLRAINWTGRKLSTKTKNLYRTHLRIFFQFCVPRWLDKNPVDGMKRLSVKKRRTEPGAAVDPDGDKQPTMPLDEDETDTNWQKIRTGTIPFLESYARTSYMSSHPETFLALLELMYETGLRVSDATFFRPDKIVTVEGGCGEYTTNQIKTGDPVTVFLDPWLAAKLRSLPQVGSTPYVFFDGRAYWESWVNNQIRYTLSVMGNRLGIPGSLHPHRFRDSFAVNRLNEGLELHDLKELLGHRSIQTTEKHYLPFVKSRKKALARRLYATKKVVEITPKAS